MPAAPLRDPRHSAKLAVSLTAVYLIWGSSFLATKIAVNHLPIALFSAVRFLTAGSLLGTVAFVWRGAAWPKRGRDWMHCSISGFFMVFMNNGLNAWAIQYIPSNQSALLNGTAAFWIAGLGVFGKRGSALTRSTVLGLGIGFLGTALMLVPGGTSPAPHLAQSAALAACLAFAVGTVYYRSIDTALSPLLFMAMQLWLGGVMLAVVAVMHGDAARWTVDAPGMTALVYLTLVSSCLAYTAYGWLARNSTPAIIGSYSYVNPAVAALLGWVFLHEHLSRVQWAGMGVIALGVSILTLRGRTASPRAEGVSAV